MNTSTDGTYSRSKRDRGRIEEGVKRRSREKKS